MRALAAIVTLAVWSCRLHAHQTQTPRGLARLFSTLGVRDHDPVHRLVTCSQTIGPSKCLSALSVWRAGNAIEHFEKEYEPEFNVTADVERFPWEKYSNRSDEELYSELCDGAEQLLRRRPLSLSVSGYSLDLESKGDGTLNVNVLRTPDTEKASGRGSMKKLEKKFYNILPFLIIPGLIMSAILPFVLPALKLMTVAVGMLNNMALSGAIFTLLRNNAFSHDNYNKRIIYVNEGYKNEKMPLYFKHVDVPDDDIDIHYEGSDVHSVSNDGIKVDEHFGAVEEIQNPTDSEWINQYYGNEGFKLRRSSKIKVNRVKHKM